MGGSDGPDPTCRLLTGQIAVASSNGYIDVPQAYPPEPRGPGLSTASATQHCGRSGLLLIFISRGPFFDAHC
jgi:hypothetical protein